MVGAALSREFIALKFAPTEIFKYVWIDFVEYKVTL
jgi:hypothetical protein